MGDRIRTASLLAATLLAAGCLVSEPTHEWILEEDGTVTWAVLESRVRSDAREPFDRAREEAEYLESARRGNHPVGAALEALGGWSVDTEILRERRPFTVRTTARFKRPERTIEEFLDRMGIRARVTLELGGPVESLAIDLVETTGEEGDEALLPLLDGEIERYRAVLTEGKFLESRGFRLERDATVAILAGASGEPAPDEAPEYLLRWSR